MERFENLTLEQAEKMKAELLSKGYSETQTIEQVEVGPLSASAVVRVIGKVKSAIFSIITFERKDSKGKTVKLLFEAVDVNAKHSISGKLYENLKVKAVEELKEALKVPANLNKEILLKCVVTAEFIIEWLPFATIYCFNLR